MKPPEIVPDAVDAPSDRGFALVITLLLLSLLLLALVVLSSFSRIGSEVAASGGYQERAKRNALLGLTVAVGELQRYASDDTSHTGMAGVTGIPAGAGQPMRHWCGVWTSAGDISRWLVSGVEGGALPLALGETVLLAGPGSLGADATDKEHVQVPLLPISVGSRAGDIIRQGSFAYWVADEGIKLSAAIPADQSPVMGQVHAIDELIPTLSPLASALMEADAYAQLAFVPPTPLTPGQLQSNFHALGLTHLKASSGVAQAGLLNVNTTTGRFWRGVAATYNAHRPGGTPALAVAPFAGWMRDHLAAEDSDADKPAGAPYRSRERFLAGATLGVALDAAGVSKDDFGTVMRPWLVTRSHTFRVRAYGDARNPVDESKIEAVACLEAIVQRTDQPLAGFGERYAVLSFRWLGSDDI